MANKKSDKHMSDELDGQTSLLGFENSEAEEKSLEEETKKKESAKKEQTKKNGKKKSSGKSASKKNESKTASEWAADPKQEKESNEKEKNTEKNAIEKKPIENKTADEKPAKKEQTKKNGKKKSSGKSASKKNEDKISSEQIEDAKQKKEPTEEAAEKKNSAEKKETFIEKTAKDKSAEEKEIDEKSEKKEPAKKNGEKPEKKEQTKKNGKKKSDNKPASEKSEVKSDSKNVKNSGKSNVQKGFLEVTKDKQELLNSAFEDIENQLREISGASLPSEKKNKSDTQQKKTSEKRAEEKKQNKRIDSNEALAEKISEITATDNENIFIFNLEVDADTIKEDIKPETHEAEEPEVTPNPPEPKPPVKKESRKTKKAKKKADLSKNVAVSETKTSVNKPKSANQAEAFKQDPQQSEPYEAPAEEYEIRDIVDAITEDSNSDIETADKHIKPLPAIVSLFVPTQKDGIWEIIRKGLVVICLIILAVSMVILVKSTKQPKGKDDVGSNFVTKYVNSYTVNQANDNLTDSE